MGQQLAIVLVGVGGVLVLGILRLIARTWRQVEQGRAMIVNKMGTEPKVTFTGAIVLPIVNKAEVMDLSVKTIDVSRRAKDGLICADNIRADIKVTFFVRVNKTVDDVLRVAQSIGCVRASQQATLEVLDPNNVLDSLGIKKITEITTSAAIDTNLLKQRERMELGKQNLTSDEAIFRFEQARAEAEAKKNKEIAIALAREENEANRFRLDEEQN